MLLSPELAFSLLLCSCSSSHRVLSFSLLTRDMYTSALSRLRGYLIAELAYTTWPLFLFPALVQRFTLAWMASIHSTSTPSYLQRPHNRSLRLILNFPQGFSLRQSLTSLVILILAPLRLSTPPASSTPQQSQKKGNNLLPRRSFLVPRARN